MHGASVQHKKEVAKYVAGSSGGSGTAAGLSGGSGLLLEQDIDALFTDLSQQLATEEQQVCLSYS